MIEQALTFISIDWLKPLAAKLKKIRDEREAEIRKISDSFGDPELLARYYVEPNCQHHNPADHEEDEAPISQVKAPVFKLINDFLNKKIDDSLRDGRTQLFILADAGMGKTSLLVMLKLAHILAFWPKGYDCLLLKLGPDTLKAISEQANKANTILLLDALDEDPTAWGRFEERLIELLLETKNFRRVLITCRTQFFPETGADPFGNPGRVTVSGFICPMLFLSLFDDRQVSDYLRKRFPDPWHHGLTGRENERRRHAEQLLKPMRSLRSRPLLLAHIDLLEVKAQQWNEYTTYEALIETWLLREVRKLASQGVKPLPLKADLWAACTAVAVQMQSQGQRTLSQADLQELVTAMPAIGNIERFDFGGRSLMNRTSDHTYRFSHYSIQEFLVVHALVKGGLDAIKAACPKATQPLQVRATAQMLDFVRCRFTEEFPLDYLQWLDISGIKSDQLANLRFRDRLKDGSSGPAMVVIPGGRFLMGSPANEPGRQDNERQHEVQVAVFAIGKYAVTVGQFKRFVEAKGYRTEAEDGGGCYYWTGSEWKQDPDKNWRNPGFTQTDNHPVVGVSWNDAMAYVRWLSEQTDQQYRLPTEAEWEYACRAGTATPFHFGETISTDQANYNGNYVYGKGHKGVYRQKTVEVGQFPPNAWGLHDMHGNVWEWTCSVYDKDYGGGEQRCAEPGTSGPCVLRGGSWLLVPRRVRGAARLGRDPRNRGVYGGFRLARTFP
jgi:formylglycine-generating enzyme required for sulfatase activity